MKVSSPQLSTSWRQQQDSNRSFFISLQRAPNGHIVKPGHSVYPWIFPLIEALFTRRLQTEHSATRPTQDSVLMAKHEQRHTLKSSRHWIHTSLAVPSMFGEQLKTSNAFYCAPSAPRQLSSGNNRIHCSGTYCFVDSVTRLNKVTTTLCILFFCSNPLVAYLPV